MSLKNLKKALSELNAQEAATNIVKLYMENPINFKKSLLLSTSLPEPIGKSFSKEKLNTLRKAFLIAGKQLIEKNVDILIYTNDVYQISEVIKILGQPELFTEIQKLIITYGLPSLFGFIVIH